MSISQAHQDRLVAQGRDEMMTAFLKSLERAPSEAQQRSAAERFAGFMQEIIPQIVGVVATGDYPAFAVKLENIDGKGKIALKAIDVDKAGPALITKLGSSLTLVLTDVEQFDLERPAAYFEPDQRPLPLEVAADKAFVEEMGEIAETDGGEIDTIIAEADQPAGPLFTAVEDEECRLPDGTTIKPWTIVHGALEVFTPVDAKAFVDACTDRLNGLSADIERDLTPVEVRKLILGILHARQENIGIAFHAPYSEDAPAVQDNTAPAGEAKPKRGPKSATEKVAAYFAGYDGAASDLFADDCPHERGSLREEWLGGLQDAKGGKPPRWSRPVGILSPKEQGRVAFVAGSAYLDGHPADMPFPDIGQWREGWKEAEAAAQQPQAAANDDGEEPRESSGNVAA